MTWMEDDLVTQVFKYRENKEPDADPGDLTIVVQDDVPLVEVVQRGQTIGRGATMLDALHNALENIAMGRAYGITGWEPLLSHEASWRARREREDANERIEREAFREVVVALTEGRPIDFKGKYVPRWLQEELGILTAPANRPNLDGVRWEVAPDCDGRHPYGEEGWRPGLQGCEHLVTVPCDPVEEDDHRQDLEP